MKSASKEELDALRDSTLFDAKYYLEQYPDVKMLGMDPLDHYLWIGATIGRNPSKDFSTSSYLSLHTDVADANINPLFHYVKWGISEGRSLPPHGQVAATEFLSCDRIIKRKLGEWDFRREQDLIGRIHAKTQSPNDIFVSIVMPTFNRADCISKAINSVLKQTHENWELIIADDGSTDQTSFTVGTFRDHRIIYDRHKRSRGVSAARNAGLRKSSGEWIFFLDSDNSWHPQYIENMLRFAEYHNLSAAYCGAEIKGDHDETKGYLFADFDFESCVKQNFIDLNTFGAKARLAKVGFDESLRRLVDWDYILRIAARTRLRGAHYLGVTYYDGDRHNRITRKEYRKKGHLESIMEQIRARAKEEIARHLHDNGERSDRIAVVFHVYHREHVDECLAYVENIGRKFDLFVTSRYNDDDETISRIRAKFPDAITIQYPNVGFDIGPFLGLVSTLSNYKLICKFHAKRDVAPWGGIWRTAILQGLLGSRQLVERIVSEFDTDDRLLSVGPRELFKNVSARSTHKTRNHLVTLSTALDMRAALDHECGFFAGSGFWIKPACLYKVARYACDAPSYSATYSKDDLIEHALERIFGVVMLENTPSFVGLTEVKPDGKFTFSKQAADKGHSKEAITQTLDRLIKSKPVRAIVRYYPDYTSTNVYQKLLYGGFDGYDVGSGNVVESIDLQKKTGNVILHLHWINAILGSARTKAEAAKIASDYVRKLREFVECGGRLVWTVHNVVSHEPQYLEQELVLSRALIEMADWIHVHHASVVEATKPFYELPEHKILVAEHGNYIGTLPDDMTRGQARSELGIPGNHRVFLFLGQIRGYKGIDELLDAFSELSSKHDDCWLVIAGKILGISQNEIERKLSGCRNVVFRPGHVPDERMQVYLKSADAMVLPYRKVLTSGSVFLAMSFGLPVICPRAGLLSHIVEDGRNGILYGAEETDGLLRSMQRFMGVLAPDAERMREYAFKTAQLYRWEETSAKLRRHIEGSDFGQIMRTEIEGNRRIWFARGDLDAIKKKRCIAIVLHYQNLDDTRECLERLQKQGRDIGIILISNAETLHDVRQMATRFPDIVAVQSEDNVGYAAANNFGLSICRQSETEYFWIINPDIVIPDGFYDELVKRTDSWPDHDFFGSTIVPSHQPEKAIFCGGEVRLDQGARPGHLYAGRVRAELPVQPFECDYLTGANIFGRTRALAKAGYMPEHYFLYFEETDWFLDMHMNKSIRKPIVFPDIYVENHKRSENGLIPSKYYIYYFIRNSLNFGMKFSSEQMNICKQEARKFADAWLNKVARGAPDRLGEFQKLVERAFEDGSNSRVGRVMLDQI